MIDRDKVIKGLELCRYDPDPGQPSKYEVSCDICPYSSDRYGCRMGELLNDALMLLREKEVVPHRNYQYLSDYWCECGWHLGKKGGVKYCSDCGRKVKWDE